MYVFMYIYIYVYIYIFMNIYHDNIIVKKCETFFISLCLFSIRLFLISFLVEYEKSQGKKLDRFFSCYPDSFTHPEVYAFTYILLVYMLFYVYTYFWMFCILCRDVCLSWGDYIFICVCTYIYINIHICINIYIYIYIYIP
jgi:hypothetical protein